MDHCPSRATGAADAALLIAAAPLPALAQASDPFLGQVMCAGFNFEPRGWAELNGQLLSIAQNTALFALLGTQYGGNGQTTFALPDMRGRAMLHAGQGPGLTLRDQGERAGAEAVSISVAQMPMHSHNVSPQASSSDGSLTSPLNAVPAGTKPNAKIYAPAFFAREDTKAPMRYAITSMVLNIVIGAALFFGLRSMGVPGFQGLAIATSFAAWVNVLLMIRALIARNAYRPSPSAFSRLLRITFASGVLFAVLWFAGANRDELEAALGSKEAAIALLIFGGGTLYFAVASFESRWTAASASVIERSMCFLNSASGPGGGGGSLMSDDVALPRK